jgi:hypothetical protein
MQDHHNPGRPAGRPWKTKNEQITQDSLKWAQAVLAEPSKYTPLQVQLARGTIQRLGGKS